jgi:hypothetical protein
MDHLAALKETPSFHQHCTGSKGGHGSASIIQLSSKNLDCQSNSGFNTEENTVNLFQDIKSNTVSINFDQSKIYSDQSNYTNSLVSTPTQHAECLAALWETLSFNQHRIGNKSSCVQVFYFQMLSKNPVCGKRREEYFGEYSRSKTWVFIQVIFGFNEVKYTEKMINSFRCSKIVIYLFTEGFHTEKKNEFQRTPANIVSLFFDQYRETRRRTAAEQMGSPFRSVHQILAQVPVLPEPRIWDPVTLSNLVPIGNNQWDQVDKTSD